MSKRKSTKSPIAAVSSSPATTKSAPKRKTSIFQMPQAQSMVGRTSSITNAFVNAIIPPIAPTFEEEREAIAVLGMSEDDVRCAYCGDPSTEWDHLNPLVVNQRPTGYISEIANLVPACGKCNQSKGNKDWRIWMLSAAKRSPTTRGKTDVAERIERLEAYTKWREPRRVKFEDVLGSDHYAKYWVLWEETIAKLKECQAIADELREKVRVKLADHDA